MKRVIATIIVISFTLACATTPTNTPSPTPTNTPTPTTSGQQLYAEQVEQTRIAPCVERFRRLCDGLGEWCLRGFDKAPYADESQLDDYLSLAYGPHFVNTFKDSKDIKDTWRVGANYRKIADRRCR